MLDALKRKIKGIVGNVSQGSSAKQGASDGDSGAEMPYGTKISKISRDGVEFYWKKPERANGYEVFRAYEADGPFECIASIDTRKCGDYTDNDFDHTVKSLYYSIRSYITTDDGEKIFSERTEPVEAAFIKDIKPERETTYMYSGSTRKIMAAYGWGEPEDAVWSSCDPSIATVTEDGVITAVATGTCTIKCTSASLGLECSSEVVVNREPTVPVMPDSERFHYDEAAGVWKNPDSEASGKAVIMMVGDLMCGSGQMRKQTTADGSWDFSSSFEYVRPVTQTSDFAVANLETLLASPWPYMIDEIYIDNKNNCNAPSRYLDAVRYGGFDAVTLSNNHNCDGGVRALMDTIDQVELYEYPYTGVFRSADDPRFMIAEINGIKIGFLAYMSQKTTFNGKDADWSKEEKAAHLHVYTKEKACRDVKACREAGAEYVIAYMHWGVKNFRNITDDQRTLAQGMADAGADFIVGSNPHIVQIYDEITTSDGRNVPCYYSVGNFQAKMNQIPGNRDSLLVYLELKKDESGKVEISENSYIPFHCYTNVEDCLWAPVPLNKRYNTSPRSSKKIHDRIVEAVGNKVKERL